VPGTISAVAPSSHGGAAYLVNDLGSLQALKTQAGLAHRSVPVRVSIKEATAAENSAWERGLRRHLGACGCELGAAFVALVLGAFFLTRAGLGQRLSPELGREIGLWVGIGFVAALAGKLLGLAHSGLALRRIGREIALASERGRP
jgi:hypothetical protein